jgi:hypothetical protein
MLSRRECEFFLLRYVPDPVRNEFVHVGVIVRDAAGTAEKDAVRVETAVRFTKDWRRVRCLDPDADTDMLEGLESELRRRFLEEQEEVSGGRDLMHLLQTSFSNSVQVTRAKAYLAESIETGVEELMRMYVEPLKRERGAARTAGRPAILLRMRTEFERAGVWDRMRKRIAASAYTRAGDPLRIDVGYQTGAGYQFGLTGSGTSTIRMFQAVSLDAAAQSSEMAKVLAFSAAGLAAGVERVEKAKLELTAVVEPVREAGNRELKTGTRDQGSGIRKPETAEGEELDAEWVESYRFAVETMEEHGIRVVTTADLGRAAETARRELAV